MVLSVITILASIIQLYIIMLLVYGLMSWIPGLREGKFGQLLGKLCEPYLSLFKFIPPIGMLDISYTVAIIALMFARIGLVNLIITIFG